MGTVKKILEAKGSNIWSVAPQATVFEALQIMSDKNVGALLVIDNDELVGIFSERDYARKLILEGKSSADTLVNELMTAEVIYIDPHSTVENCMALMTAKKIRHLPVMENHQLIGIVTIGDVGKRIISDQEFTIRQLGTYVTSGTWD